MVDFFKEKKNLIIIIAIIVIVLGYYLFNRFTDDKTDTMEFNMLEVAENTNEEEDSDTDTIVVHITGAIKEPGIVRLKEDSRIEDAIEAAGGLTEDSDISNVNLAYPLEDGVKIRIPTVDDAQKDDEEDSYVTEDSGSNVILDNESGRENELIN